MKVGGSPVLKGRVNSPEKLERDVGCVGDLLSTERLCRETLYTANTAYHKHYAI